MSFVDMMITRRHFTARYVHLGRALLGDLAVAYGIDFDLAEQWADDIDRESFTQSAALDPEASHGGAGPSGAACTAAPDFSHNYPVGSRRGSGAAASPLAAAAPAQLHRS